MRGKERKKRMKSQLQAQMDKLLRRYHADNS
jgi:hypothetical protein